MHFVFCFLCFVFCVLLCLLCLCFFKFKFQFLQKSRHNSSNTMSQSSSLFSPEVLEQMFACQEGSYYSHVYECSKVGLPVDFTIPVADGTIQTLEAMQSYLGRTPENAETFHVLVSSSATPPYPVLASEFLKRYDIVSATTNNNKISDVIALCNSEVTAGTAIPRCFPIHVIRAPVSGSLATSWGSVLPFSPDSFIARYKENDFSVIEKDVFAKTYQIHEEWLDHNVEFCQESGDVLIYRVFYDGTKSLADIEADLLVQLVEKTGLDVDNIQIFVGDFFRFGDLQCPSNYSFGDVLSSFSFLSMVCY